MADVIDGSIPGIMPWDANKSPMNVARRILCEDATGTPIISPKTAVPVTPLLFTRPSNAVAFVFRASATAYYGENATLDGSATGKGYHTASANVDCVVPCAGMTGVYVRAASGTVTVDFHWELM